MWRSAVCVKDTGLHGACMLRISGLLLLRFKRHRPSLWSSASCEVRTEFIYVIWKKVDRLGGLVVRVPGYRPRGPGTIPGPTRFSEK
jgi:hypothetical protein